MESAQQDGYWLCRLSVNANEAKVFRPHAAPQGPCELGQRAQDVWRTSRRMVTPRFRASSLDNMKEAEKGSWMG